LDIHQFDAWIGRQTQQQDSLTLPLVQRLAAALDCDPAQFNQGDALPRGWHAVLFSPLAKTSDLDADGHPRIDSGVIRAAEVTKIRQVEGKTGLLVFVTARYTLSGLDGVPAVIEEQDLAYREETIMAPSRASSPHAESEWGMSLDFDAPRLFRFSAAVFNAHRIHYDADYARDVEGYDGLIVNAGLITLHLLGLSERHWALPINNIDVRNRGLVFAGSPVNVQGCVIDGKQVVQASQNGKLCVEMLVNA
jgi:3-methylfumaryl-CoA hydratase